MQAATRRPTFTKAARRAQIVQATIATVNELGYHRTSLAGIAERAGVAKSAVVYYFGSKETLLLHVLEEAFTELGAAVEVAVAAESTPVERLRAYAQSYIAHVDAHRPEMAAAVAIVISHRNAEGTPLYLTEQEEDSVLLRDILSSGMESGEFRRMPLADAVRIAESILDIAITAVQRDLAADIASLAPETTGFLLRGFAPG